jgi:hypothetical protein
VRLKRLLIDQATFEASWLQLSRGKRLLCVVVLTLLPAVTLFAFAVMGPRLTREGALLWFGTFVDGTVRSANVTEVGKFKNGAPKYRLIITFDFPTPDGRRHDGSTERNDIGSLPTLQPGDKIGVYYDETRPDRSVADYNLRTDVYALLLFLPFLAVFGLVLPAWYAVTGLLALRRRRARERSTHWVRKAP